MGLSSSQTRFKENTSILLVVTFYVDVATRERLLAVPFLPLSEHSDPNE